MDGGTQSNTPTNSPIQHTAKTETKTVKAEIKLEPRPGDKPVDSRLLNQFDLFRRMKKPISAEKLPGGIVLRNYSKGQIIFQQGQAGGTAFYIPNADDLNRLSEFDKDLQIQSTPSNDPERDRQVLTAVIVPSTPRTRSKGFFERLFSPSTKAPSRQVSSIPSDGPTDINYKTREAPLMEGDIFGEMSCISFTPRSATVIARVDCLLLEFNRNVFETLRDDPNHQKKVDEEYSRRTLDTHLRQFQIFSGLTESQIQTLKDNVTLEIYPPGKVICEEGEPWSDSKPLDVFIVRNGVVQVIANTNLSLGMDDIRDWTAFCRQLNDSQPEAPKVIAKPVASPAVRATGNTTPIEARPRTIPESAAPPQVITDKGSATATTSAPLQTGSATKKLSPLEQMRAKKAAEANAQEPTTAAADQPATPPAETKSEEPAAPQKKLSPIELMRAKKAAEANAQQPPAAAGDQPATPPAEVKSEEPAAPQKKLSPIEQMRAKKAGIGSDQVPSEPPANTPASGQSTSQAGKTGPSTGNLDTPPVPSGKPTTDVDSKRPLLKEKHSGEPGSLVFLVKSWLNGHVLEAAQQIGNQSLTGEPLARAQELILSALNQLLGRPDFLNDDRLIADVYSKPELLRKVATFPKGTKGIKKDWSELELRTAGRAAFSEIFPKLIRKPVESSGPPRVLAYLSRGECFGEIAVVTRSPRNASCIAYNHPSTEEVRDFGNVELVRIPGAAFRKLMDESPALKQQVESLAQTRVNQTKSSGSKHTETDLIASAEFQKMGLFQGTRLLVIDLDSCTRCGDCVEACVKTHDDGYSRLFLDGPRYDRFLVPSACRNCLNPVCMLGCPVGSIARGNNGQIEIYDWCIGCSKCADQCPYDSIQMHDLGLIPEESLGWLCASRRSLPDDWYRARRLSGGWMQGSSPFLWQGDFLRNLTESVSDSESLSICFRHEFRLPKKSKTSHYRLSINEDRRKSTLKKVRVDKSKVLGVWLNGKKLELTGNSIDLATEDFLTSENLLAVEVSLGSDTSYGQIVLSACLDAVPEASAQTRAILGDQVLPEMDLVTSRAAVCDLCSHLPSQQPACVTSCPHDAAIRINPLINFPT